MLPNRRPLSGYLLQCVACLLLCVAASGCGAKPLLIPASARQTIDRGVVEYPADCSLQTIVRNLRAPTAICFDAKGTLIIADQGLDKEPQIFGYRADGVSIQIYPREKRLWGMGEVRGPVGGMVAANDRVYVLHRDRNDRGVVSAFDYEGNRQTIVADLPCEGDRGVLDLVINPADGRLYFSIGSVTNSGVVGLDNWAQGWVDRHKDASDWPAVPYRLLGYRFDTPNPRAGLFGGSDIAVTGPFQPFGLSQQIWAQPSPTGKPTAAVYSVSPAGGDLRVEAHGIRCARGLAFNDYGRLYATNQGMELRGTRPVRDDPDALLRIVRNTWYGWPDYTADLQPVVDRRFQPPAEMIVRTGYPELSSLIDLQASGLLRPDRRTLVQAVFQPLSGAAKMAFVPAKGPLSKYQGTVIVALSGDRAPFATSGYPLVGPIGYKVVQVDVDNHTTTDFVYNTRSTDAGNERHRLQRPVDVKFAPDGSMFILDVGEVEIRGARVKPVGRTGKILRLDGPQTSGAQ